MTPEIRNWSSVVIGPAIANHVLECGVGCLLRCQG